MFLRNVIKGLRDVRTDSLLASWITCRRQWPHCVESRSPPTKDFSTCPRGMKVTICGAAGCTGQPLSLLMKQCPLLDELALYDQCATCGFGLELSHVDTRCKVSSYSGRHMICDALKDSTVVVILARDCCNTFEANAPILTEIALQICNACPQAFTIIATEPVESLVPLVGEIYRLRNMYDPRKLIGVVELNCVRANTVLADFLRVPPETVSVPVIGGARPQTMVPVLSSSIHPCTMSQEQVECVTSCIMNGDEAVCAAMNCATATPCLSGAYAIARVTTNVVKGIQGTRTKQCAYVDSLHQCAPCIQFFSSEVILGPGGVETNLGVPDLSKFENCLLHNCLPYVRNEQARATWLVYSMCQCCCNARCSVHPNTCFTQPAVPCVPPCNWSNDYPDPPVDQYLASICRDMTCRAGSTELIWRPRPCDVDAARALNEANQIPRMCYTGDNEPPRSVRMHKLLLEKATKPNCA